MRTNAGTVLLVVVIVFVAVIVVQFLLGAIG